jgi:rod shape-determining protein MreD
VATERRSGYIQIALIGIAALILQIGFVPLLAIGAWRPNLIILIVIFAGFRLGVIPGTLTGFFLGLLTDVFSPGPIGITALAGSIVGFLAGQLKTVKLAYNTQLLSGIVLILIDGLIFYYIYSYQAETTFLYLIFSRVFPNTIYTFMIGFFLSLFFRSKLESI